MIEIFVDADACPVKDEVYVVATRHGVPVALVSNSPLRVPDGMGVELVLVGQGADAADDWIVDHLRTDDVVVTGDIPLAARVLEAGGHAVGPNGREFTEDAIGGLVATRNLKSDLRDRGVGSGGPPPISDRDRSRFLSRLDEVVRRALRAQTGG